jgi:hypothetical protein
VGQLRYPVGFAKFHRLDGLHARPPVEYPRLDGPGRRLDLQEGAAKRHLPSVSGQEDEVVVTADAQVDRAGPHFLPVGGDGFAHVLGLGQDVEDELDGGVEVPGEDDLEVARELDTGRSASFRCHCRLLVVAAL